VASIQWIDVYADEASEAQRLAGQIYNDASDAEREAFPSVVVAYDVDDVEGIDRVVSLILETELEEFDPNNDPF
jgi:hypothetical protein